MIIYVRGIARIQHGETAEVYEIHEDELEWESVGGDERSMGPETIYQAIVEHEELGELRWTISEYPVGAEGIKDTNVGKHRVIEDFEYGLEHEPEFDDGDPGQILDQLKNDPKWAASLTKSTIVRYLIEWFQNFYEDPANETPYNSREGGYQYIYGGPYSAEEELRDSFEGVVSDEAIMQAVEELQRDGIFDWAPSDRHPEKIAFYDNGDEEELGQEQDQYDFDSLRRIAAENGATGLGTEKEAITRAEVLDLLAALKADLPQEAKHGGIGHNNPPGEFDLQGKELIEVSESLEVIEAELRDDAPNIERVAERASFIKRAAGWLANKLDKTVDEFCKAFGSTLGKAVGVGLPAAVLASPYWGKLIALLGGLKEWLLIVLGL